MVEAQKVEAAAVPVKVPVPVLVRPAGPVPKKRKLNPKAKLGDRRTRGVGDRVSLQLLHCKTVHEMLALAQRLGVPPADLKKYRASGLHLGILRMAIGNRIRAVQRRKEARKLMTKKKTRSDYEVLT